MQDNLIFQACWTQLNPSNSSFWHTTLVDVEGKTVSGEPWEKIGPGGALFTQWQPSTLAFRSVKVLKTAPVHPSEAGSRCFLDSKMEFWPEGPLCFLAPSAEMHGHLTHVGLCQRRTVGCRSHTHLCQSLGYQGYFGGLVHAASHLSVESTIWRHWLCGHCDLKKKIGSNRVEFVSMIESLKHLPENINKKKASLLFLQSMQQQISSASI